MKAHSKRNTGMPLQLARIESLRVNLSAAERRVQSLAGRRSIKSAWQAAWLLKAISLIALTTLAGDDTAGRVQRLCAKAKNPVARSTLEALGVGDMPLHTAAVCVYHDMLPVAVDAVRDSGVEVAAVSTGFPAGLSPLSTRLQEIRESVAAGATEIDIVISRRHALSGNWEALYDEVQTMREACGPAHMKAILATGELGSLRTVARASMVCMMAGADFIKTSTGKETVNATLPVTLIMLRMIREYAQMSGSAVGFKPAGGIGKAKDALLYLALLKEELGREWLEPSLFRFGASSLLGDIERQLEHAATGRYSASFRHALS